MFLVLVGSCLTTWLFIRDLFDGNDSAAFSGWITGWLWFTLIFANFAEAMAESRGKAQADSLRLDPRDHVGKPDRRRRGSRVRPVF